MKFIDWDGFRPLSGNHLENVEEAQLFART